MLPKTEIAIAAGIMAFFAFGWSATLLVAETRHEQRLRFVEFMKGADSNHDGTVTATEYRLRLYEWRKQEGLTGS